MNTERERLEQQRQGSHAWDLWGPYLAERAWGTVREDYSAKGTARDSFVTAVVTLGEGYHNFHHTFQADYRNGPAWYNIDVTKWLIWVLSRVGMAGGLRRMPVDVTLGRRFEQARRDLDSRLRDFDERARAALTAHLGPLESICEFRRVLEKRNTIDVVLGSRIPLLGRDIQRRPLRRILGRVFARTASLVLGLSLYDTQCGAKLFRVNAETTAIDTSRNKIRECCLRALRADFDISF